MEALSRTERVELGQFLKEWRIKADYSQPSIAKKLGYNTPQVISNWERGAANVPAHALSGLVKYYKIPQGTMLGFLADVHTKYWAKKLYKVARK